jgi:hypothetical protein
MSNAEEGFNRAKLYATLARAQVVRCVLAGGTLRSMEPLLAATQQAKQRAQASALAPIRSALLPPFFSACHSPITPLCLLSALTSLPPWYPLHDTRKALRQELDKCSTF